MNKAVRGFSKLAAAVILTLGFTGCGGDNGTGTNPDPDKPGGGGGGTVKIGNQTWMKKNLDRATTNSKCYENSADSCGKYGRLYTWSDAKTACPSGWHLPSDAEWTTLEDYVGDRGVAGVKLKSTSGWDYIGGGTDEYGFSALPGGYGKSDGSFLGAGGYGHWWSATEVDASNALYRSITMTLGSAGRYSDDKASLYSVRCLQD